jgi:glycosyltransferase involved in cell wall biosynthesis
MDHVVVHGAVPHVDIYKLLSQAHAVLLPSFHEAMPCAPIEGQFCGCIPITSRLSGVTDTIIDDGTTGFLVDVGDVAGFFEAISQLINDPARWQAMSNACQRHAHAEFTLDTLGRRFDQLITACLQGKYQLPRTRRSWLPVNPLAFTWRDAIPRGIHRLGVGKLLRDIIAFRKASS